MTHFDNALWGTHDRAIEESQKVHALCHIVYVEVDSISRKYNLLLWQSGRSRVQCQKILRSGPLDVSNHCIYFLKCVSLAFICIWIM